MAFTMNDWDYDSDTDWDDGTWLGKIFVAVRRGNPERVFDTVNPQLIPEILFDTEDTLMTPLSYAARCGNLGVVNVLLDYQNKYCGGDLKLRSNTNTFEALRVAANNEHQTIVETLLQTEDDVNRVGCSGETALHALCGSRKYVTGAVECLISRGAKLDIADAKGETCLFNACREASEYVVRLLLAKGADLHHRSLSLSTPLHAAATRQDCEVARLLLQRGARVSEDVNGYTPVLWAALHSSKSCVDYFLPAISRKEKIDALELLGAVLSSSKHGGSYTYFKKAMDERYRIHADVITKPQRLPVADLGSVVESQTPQELESLQHDWYKLGLEGLLVMERILGEDNKYVMKNCDYFSKALTCKHCYEEAFVVWKYSRRHSVFHYKLSLLQHRIFHIFYAMECRRFPATFLHYHDVLHLTVQEMEVQARAAEQDKKYLWWAANNVRECVRYRGRALPLASSDGDLNQLQDVTTRLISVAPRFHPFSVIHHAWEQVGHSAMGEDPESTASFASLLAFLVKCGADVNGKNDANKTLLHRICQREWEIQDERKKNVCSMARLTLELGADVDARNGENRTPLDMAMSEDMRAVLLEHYPLSLKCLAASAIVERGIPYQGRVPSTVDHFIRIHDRC